jgi:hypothetical protein
MFQDKNLRNTLWLALFAVISPVWLIITIEGDFAAYSIAKAVLIPVLGFVCAVKVVINVIENWKNWKHLWLKIVLLLIAFSVIIFGVYVILLVYNIKTIG